MSDLDNLRILEQTLGVKLKQVTPDKITNLDIEYKYCLNNKDSVTGLNIAPLKNNLNINFIELLPWFKDLQYFILINTNLVDISFLKELKRLSLLGLSNNQIKNIPFLKGLKYLTKLYLSRNQITDISAIKELKGLTTLDLSGNKIYYLSALRELIKLTRLDLSGNQLKNIPALKELKGLIQLNLNRNQIQDISALKDLKGLTVLDLGENRITDISSLKNLKELTELSLYDNQIIDSSFLKELKGLTVLDLGENRITDISFLKGLKELSHLDLSGNRITDISFLEGLKGLTKLYLSNNQITDISFLKDLKGLSHLDLSGNQITDISFLKGLKGLTKLYLSYNEITDISFLKDLKGLTKLYLSYNEITDISFLKDLKELTKLDLSNNQIKEIPEWLTEKMLKIHLTKEYSFSGINFYDNPLKTPPGKIVRQGNDAIKEWYRQAKKYDTEKAYEAKILLVGEPDAGKTTFMRLLFDKKHPVPLPQSAQPSTLGIEVQNDRMFKNPKRGKPKIKAHIWDFGGQDIQYMLHQYFLSDDAVYILITDGRSGKTRYGYWFHIINLLGKNSPVLVVLNRHANQETVVSFDSSLYKKNFPDLKIEDLGEIDLGNLNHKWDYIINEIALKLSGLPIVGQNILKPWKPIRDEIEKLRPQKHITLSKFEEICHRNGLEEAGEVKFLLDYFHKIGFVLNFEEETLQNTVFLDPNWITHAIYDALSDTVIIDKNGEFEKEKLYQHWQKKLCDKTHTQQYSQTECNYLLNLMLKDRLDVCYQLEHKPGFYMVPMKLPDKRPDYTLDTTNNLHFRFQYPFMPEGLLSRLIVRLHEYIDDGRVWLTGAVFKEDGCIAEVLQNETTQEGIKYIGIRIKGNDLNARQRMLRNIRREIEHIHRNTFPYINFSEMVVCNCPVCVKREDPNFYSYEDLKIKLEYKELYEFCIKGKQRVDIRRMIGEVYMPDDFDKDGNKKPVESKQELKTLKIFLASSSELEEDRKEFEIFINRENKKYTEKGIFLKLELWEDSIDAISQTRLQDEYNKTVKECDIFVMLFFTKVGKYTKEEFTTAFGQFKETNKPRIYTYFKNAEIKTGDINEQDVKSVKAFQRKLKKLGHFQSEYKNIEDLKYKFSEQLIKIIPQLTGKGEQE